MGSQHVQEEQGFSCTTPVNCPLGEMQSYAQTLDNQGICPQWKNITQLLAKIINNEKNQVPI